MFVLYGFPLPPSSNKLYASVRGRLIKTIEGRKYDSSVSRFGLIKFKMLDRIKEHLKPDQTLNVECIFVFHKNRIIGKKGQIKKLDASNRVKQVHDGLAKLIGIDDSYFISSPIQKVTCEHEKDEQVIIIIRPAQLKSLDDIKNELSSL